jgi:hypothetical protein
MRKHDEDDANDLEDQLSMPGSKNNLQFFVKILKLQKEPTCLPTGWVEECYLQSCKPVTIITAL